MPNRSRTGWRKAVAAIFRFDLLSLLLVVGCCASWTSYWVKKEHRQRLTTEVRSLRSQLGELVVKDPSKFALEKSRDSWNDEPVWQVWIPDGEYILCVADSLKSPPIYRDRIASGRRRIALSALAEKNDWRVTVSVDREELPLEMVFPRDQDDYRNKNEFGVSVGELFHQYNKRKVSDDHFEILGANLRRKLKPDAESNALKVWIEPIE